MADTEAILIRKVQLPFGEHSGPRSYSLGGYERHAFHFYLIQIVEYATLLLAMLHIQYMKPIIHSFYLVEPVVINNVFATLTCIYFYLRTNTVSFHSYI